MNKHTRTLNFPNKFLHDGIILGKAPQNPELLRGFQEKALVFPQLRVSRTQ